MVPEELGISMRLKVRSGDTPGTGPHVHTPVRGRRYAARGVTRRLGRLTSVAQLCSFREIDTGSARHLDSEGIQSTSSTSWRWK